MIYTSNKRLSIARWLKEENPEEFYSSLKLQKYLFFYEAFSKALDKEGSFYKLKGYEKGPVFSEVYADYTYRKDDFVEAVDGSNTNDIELEIAKKSGFLVKIMVEEELSELTHNLDVWKDKSHQILSGEKQVELAQDITPSDKKFLLQLLDIYDEAEIDNSEVISIGNKKFIFSTDDFADISEVHKDTLEKLAQVEGLVNPVFVSIGEKGELLVD
ncbi:hypothetical protein HCJ66_15610 [Listeria sp. FSL L7-1582]|uniref:hypothetical protein n=1 Tax=Listeria portnoyi TaxID=2713504 RepID=UPI00164D8FB3|nr:hypothetical protein [Listeria portnoyi]MBC6310963.1 hypothetical protein [Listeria portnoyi]